jgi:adenosylmethionine-8-amino-7-oxononanoate aminotransferase
VSAVILEPVQNAGGCFTPPDGYFQRVREICDELRRAADLRRGHLLVGRSGYYFGAERYGYQPDIITTAKGITSAYAPMGAVIASDAGLRARSPTARPRSCTASPSAGTRSRPPVAMANLDVFEHEGILENVREHEGDLRAMLESLRDIEIVGDVRGAGYFHAIELVPDRETKPTSRASRARR